MLRRTRPVARSMKRPSKALRDILRPMGKKFGPGVRDLKIRWPEIAGPRLAAISTPQKLTGSKGAQTLTLIARGSAAMLLQAQSTQLLERINLISGSGTVTRIRMVQGPITANKESTPIITKQQSYTPEQLTALDQQLKGITDHKLKSALRELGLGVISQG